MSNSKADSNGNSSIRTLTRTPIETPSTSTATVPTTKPKYDGWQITLNQFIATTIPVPLISDYFTRRTYIKEGVERLQKLRRKNFNPSQQQ